MALFPVNQNVQWFTPTTAEIAELKKTANTSTLLKKAAGKVWFSAKSGKNVHASEVVTLANHGYIKYVPASKMAHTAKYVKFSMNSAINSGNPIAGETYGIYINQRNYHALGDNNFMEIGAEVVAAPSGTVSDLLKNLAIAFYNNLGTDRDLYKVYLEKNASGTLTLVEVVDATYGTIIHPETYSDTYQAIFIAEKEQDWIQGTMRREDVDMSLGNINLSNVVYNTVEYNNWANITEVKTFESYGSNTISVGTPVNYSGTLYETSTAHSNDTWSSGHFTTTSHTLATWSNSKDVADMEWFYLGEHGDQMRLMGYPNVNPAQIGGGYYNINAASTDGYDLIYIHHAYVGSNHAVQKSEQDIIIAVPVNSNDGRDVASRLAKTLGVSDVDPDAGSPTYVSSNIVYPF